MSSSSNPEVRGLLGARLREIRKGAGRTGRALAETADWHPSKVSRIEHGMRIPSEEDIAAWCKICDADDQIVDLIQTARNIDSLYVEWRRLSPEGVRLTQQSYLALYRKTRQFRIFQHSMVPGLLQTRPYASEHLRMLSEIRGTTGDLHAAVSARMGQQEVLTAPAKRFMVIVGEQALRTPMCTPDEMAMQMEQLTLFTRMPQMSLGVIPAGTTMPYVPCENFWIYDAHQVRVDTVPGQFRLRAPTDIGIYERVFTLLAEAAVYGDEARRLIRAATSHLP